MSNTDQVMQAMKSGQLIQSIAKDGKLLFHVKWSLDSVAYWLRSYAQNVMHVDEMSRAVELARNCLVEYGTQTLAAEAMTTDTDGDTPDPDAINPKTIAFIQAFNALWPNAQYGPAHILLSDYNVDDSSLAFCEQRLAEAISGTYPHDVDYSSHSGSELKATFRFLQCLREIPEDDR